MKRLIEFPLDDGSGVVYVEVDDSQTSGYDRVGAGEGALGGRAAQSFQDALTPLRPAVAAVIEKFRGLATPPDKVELQFGIKLTGKAGAVFASAETEGQLQVTLTWSSTPPQDEASGP